MKQPILILLTLFLFTFQKANAQVGKGSVIFGGGAGFNYENRADEDNLFRISLSTSVAKLISDRFAGGASFGIVYQNVGDRTRITTNILPTVRYYFTKFENNPVFYMRGQIGLALVNEKINGFKESDIGLQSSIGAGMLFFITENVSLGTLLAYNYIGGDIDITGFGLNVGFQIFLNKQE